MRETISKRVHEVVPYVELDHVPVARAIVTGSEHCADFPLYVARTSDVPHKWLDSVRKP